MILFNKLSVIINYCSKKRKFNSILSYSEEIANAELILASLLAKGAVLDEQIQAEELRIASARHRMKGVKNG